MGRLPAGRRLDDRPPSPAGNPGLQQGETYLREIQRRRKVEERIAETRRLLRARQAVIVPAGEAEGVRSQRLEGLPEGIELGAGELRIRFASREELLEKLARLAYGFLNEDEERP